MKNIDYLILFDSKTHYPFFPNSWLITGFVTGVTSGVESAYPAGVPEFTPGF